MATASHDTSAQHSAAITAIVAIDGPAGAGKSTVARRVAETLGFAFLDTGAMYRAATWNAVRRGIDLDDADALAEATRAMTLRIDEAEGRQRVCVDGVDVSEAIRSPEITALIRKLDRTQGVRDRLVALQREFGARQPTVAEGRDIGTVVFPGARCKVYMDAAPEARTRRRMAEMEAKGRPVAFDDLYRDIVTRDESDITRPIAPLRRAPDAHLLDTTAMTPDEAVDAIVRLARAAF